MLPVKFFLNWTLIKLNHFHGIQSFYNVQFDYMRNARLQMLSKIEFNPVVDILALDLLVAWQCPEKVEPALSLNTGSWGSDENNKSLSGENVCKEEAVNKAREAFSK